MTSSSRCMTSRRQQMYKEALKDLLGGTIQDMLETEMDQQMEACEEAELEYADSFTDPSRWILLFSTIATSFYNERLKDFDINKTLAEYIEI